MYPSIKHSGPLRAPQNDTIWVLSLQVTAFSRAVASFNEGDPVKPERHCIFKCILPMKFFVPFAPPLRLENWCLLSPFTSQLLLLRPLRAASRGRSPFSISEWDSGSSLRNIAFLVYPSMKFFMAFAPPLCLLCYNDTLVESITISATASPAPSLRLPFHWRDLGSSPRDTLAFEIAIRICPTTIPTLTQYPLPHYPLPPLNLC